MRHLRRLIPLVLLATVVVGARPASAATRSFAANSLIIPMDTCYQWSKNGSGLSNQPNYCVDPVNINDDGILKAYGLVWRLLQRGITIYVIIDPAKTSVTAIDMTITSPAATPVALFNRTTGGTTEFMNNTRRSIPYRGAPFVIDATDATTALNLIRTDPAFAPIFNTVDVHVAKQGFTAPVKVALTGTPPKIALMNIGGSATGVLINYLAAAGLDTATAGGVYPTSSGEIYDEFDNPVDFTSGGLITGGYRVLWSPHWVGDAKTAPGVLAAVSNFIDQGYGYFSECASIETQETSYDAGKTTIATQGYQRYHTTAGMWVNGITGWGDTAAEQWVYADPTLLYAQIGDFRFESVGGHVHSWKPAGSTIGSAYQPGVVRVLTTFKATDPAASGWDVMTYSHKDNNPKKGPIVYLGGHTYSGQVAGTRFALNTLLYLVQDVKQREVARSAPVVRSDGTTYQGSFLETTVAASSYPPALGHFREYASGALTTGLRDFDEANPTWDAASMLPAAAQRSIFTVRQVAGAWTTTQFTAGNATLLAGPMNVDPAAAATTIDAIRAGAFGGIDASTAAIVGPSSVAGQSTRPTVAYVGGLDGMMHAIVVSAGAPLPRGTELWAFIPPAQLGKIAGYQAGVNGSPAVADAYVADTTGRRSWRTLLAVTNGMFGGTVSVLDVTDPLSPQFLWVGSSPGTGFAMGAADGASFGYVNWAGTPRSVIYLATNNAGSAGNGVNLYALDASDGNVLWQWNRLYTRQIPGTVTPVPNDVPGVPAVASLAGDGALDDRVVYGDLDGRIWVFDAALAGGPPTAPLYDPGANGQPITSGVSLYREASARHLAVSAATGGADWVPSTVSTTAIGVDLEQRASGSETAGRILFQTLLAPGERVYSAPTVAGNDVYLLTSFGNINGVLKDTLADAGNLRRINLTSGTITATTALKKGAAEVTTTSDGKIVLATVTGLTTIANGGRDGAGTTLNYKPQKPLVVQSWLDLR